MPFDIAKAAGQALSLYQAGLITPQECDVAIALYMQMDRECPRYKTIQVGFELDGDEIVPVFETVTIH